MKKILVIAISIILFFVTAVFVLYFSLPTIVSSIINKNINGSFKAKSIKINLNYAEIEDMSIFDESGDIVIASKNIKINFTPIKAITGKNYLSAVQSIAIDSPEISVKSYHDGKINITSLLKPSKKKSTLDLSAFNAQISLKQGKLNFKPYNFKIPISIAVSNINILLKPNEEGQYALTFSCIENIADGNLIKATGRISLVNPFIDISAACPDFRVKRLADSILKSYGGNYNDGKTELTVILKASSSLLDDLFSSLYLKAFCNLDGASVNFPKYGVSTDNLNLIASADFDGIQIDEIEGNLLESKYSGNLSLSDFKSLRLSGNIGFKDLDVSNILKLNIIKNKIPDKIIAEGIISGISDISGSVNEPQLNCFISSKNTRIENFKLSKAELSAIVNKNKIEITNSEFISSDFKIKLNGWFFPKNMEMLLNGYASGAPPAIIKEATVGYSDCNFTVMGTVSDPIVYGSASASNIELQKQKIGNTKASFLFDKNTIYIPSVRLSNSSGEVSGGAVYDIKSGEILSSAKAQNYPIPSVAPNVSGNISGSLSLTGTLNSPLAVADMSLNSLNTGDLKFNSISIPFAANKDFINFSASGTDTKGLKISALGSSVLGDQAVNLNFSVSGIDPSKYSGLEQLAVLEAPGVLNGYINGASSVGFILDTKFSAGQSKMSAKGVLSDIKDPKILSWGSIDNLTIKPQKESELSLLQGSISKGQFLMAGGISSLDFSGFLNFNKTSVAGIPLEWIYAEAEGSKSGLNIKNVAVDTGKGSFRLSGKFDPKAKKSKLSANASNLDLNYLLSSINLKPYSNFNLKDNLPMDRWNEFQGIADFDGSIELENGTPALSGVFNVPGGVWKNENLILTSMFSVNPHGMNLKSFDLGVGYSKYSGGGKISFEESMPLDINLAAKNGDLERLISFMPIPFTHIKRGRFDGDLHIAGTINKPSVEGFLDIKDTFIAGQYVRSITANMSTENGTLKLDNFTVGLPQGTITGSGSVSKNGNLDFTFTSDDIPFSSIEPLKEWIAGSEGNIALCVRVTGTFEKPEITADVKTGGLKLMGQHLDEVSGIFSLKNSTITLNNVNATRGDETYSLSGTLDINDINDISSAFIGGKYKNSHSFKPLDIKASIKNGSIPFLVSLVPSSEKGIYSGSINADVNLSAKGNDSRLKVNFSLNNGILMGVPIDKFDVVVDRENNFLNDIQVNISVPGGNFSMVGEIDGVGEDNISIESKDFDLAIISPFLNIPAKQALSGKCNLTGSIEGELPIPNILCNFSIDAAQVGEVPIGNIRGSLETEHGSLLKASLFAEDKGQRIRISGYLPYAMNEGVFEITDNILVQSRVNLKSFNLLSLVLPIEKESSGSILGKLDIMGKYPDMAIDGELNIKDGFITPKALKNSIERINGKITLNRNHVELQDFTADMGTGRIAVEGTVDLNKTGISSADVLFKGNDLQVSAKTMFSGILDVDGKFAADNDKKRLSGKTIVKNSLISVSPMSLTKKGGSFKDMIPVFLHGTELDLGVSLKNDVWGTFMSSQVQAGGDINITGVAEDPRIKGNIRLSRGSIVVPVISSPFKLYYGSLRFDGTGIIPNVIISGDTKFDDYTANLSITGPLNEPTINIDSELPIGNASSTGNVVDGSMIYSGNTSTSSKSMDMQTSEMMNNIAFNSMLEFSVMRPILNKLGRTFGLTDVAVEFRQNGGMSVRLARALDRNERFLLTYENATNPQGQLESLWGMEYRFGRGMVIRLAKGSLGSTYVWLQARRRF